MESLLGTSLPSSISSFRLPLCLSLCGPEVVCAVPSTLTPSSLPPAVVWQVPFSMCLAPTHLHALFPPASSLGALWSLSRFCSALVSFVSTHHPCSSVPTCGLLEGRGLSQSL